jgi:hypothetical protein
MITPSYVNKEQTFSGFNLTFLPSQAVTYPRLEKFGYFLVAPFIFFACFAFIEPSPYDFIALPAIIIWLFIGLRISKYMMFFLITLILYNMGGFISLIPYFSEIDSVLFMVQSFYLAITAVFFTLFFYQKTAFRMELVLKAYTASCVFAAVAGTLGYFDILNTSELFSRYGRASGTFKDPNVLGSFLTLGALYLMFNLLIGRSKWPILSITFLLTILVGIFLSFSRGSWAGTLMAIIMMFYMTFKTTKSTVTRRRISVIGALTLMSGIAALFLIVSIPEVRQTFEKRASVTQDYDEGETGRFGNQLRSLPLLLEEPNGLGPLRFRLYFGLEPHNSYINGFASYGWLGGFAYLAITLSTIFIGFRLCFRPSPFQPYALIAWPALFMFILQAIQIDIDHWRHVYMLFGMIWGMEAARRAWQDSQQTQR